MKILALVDAETLVEGDAEFEGKTADTAATMECHVISALRRQQHEVVIEPFGDDPLDCVRRILAQKADLVFNLTEHFRGNRHLDAHIAALLELMGIPFTGSGIEGLLLCRDKATSKRLLSYHRIRLPHFFVAPVGSTALPKRINFPLVVKPAQEDGSDGISLASIVQNQEDLLTRIRMIHERMNQPAICEEYIEGREIYVGITGNERLTAYPAREIKFGPPEEGGPIIATARVKSDEKYRKKWNITYEHAGLSAPEEQRVARVSKRIYQILKIRDYGRIDLRLTSGGDVVFIEANPNPNLCRDDELAEAAQRSGLEHDGLIERIVKLAAQRYRR